MRKYGLDPQCIVSQGYDGASVMSGRCRGVQKLIRDSVPHAIYIHCQAHVLNLVLVDSVKSIPEAEEFFALLEALYVFISTSKAHTIYLAKQKEMYPKKPVRELKRLSDTRWTCRYEAINAVSHTFEALMCTLDEIAHGSDRSKGVEAMGLYLQINSFKFLLLLILFDRVLTCTKSLSDYLQNQSLDLAKAGQLVLGTISTLKEFRSDVTWSKTYAYAQQVAKCLKVQVIPLSRRRLPRECTRQLEDFVVTESTGSRDTLFTSGEYKVHLYYCILDRFICEINSRFTKENLDLMKSIEACSPQSKNFLNPDQLKALVDHYNLNEDAVMVEASIVRNTIKSCSAEIDSIMDVLREVMPLKDVVPNVMKVLTIASTIAVSTASCERSFSALKRIKSYLRSN